MSDNSPVQFSPKASPPRGDSPPRRVGSRDLSPPPRNSYSRGMSPPRGRYGDSRKENPHRIFIGNLPSGVDKPNSKDLTELFSKYGEVLRVDVKDGYGFVDFADERAMNDSLREHGKDFHRHKIRVQLSFAAQGVGSQKPRGSVPGTGSCYKCGERGHWQKECPGKPHGMGRDFRRDDRRGDRDEFRRDRRDNDRRDDMRDMRREREDFRGGRDSRIRDDDRRDFRRNDDYPRDRRRDYDRRDDRHRETFDRRNSPNSGASNFREEGPGPVRGRERQRPERDHPYRRNSPNTRFSSPRGTSPPSRARDDDYSPRND